MIKGKRSLSLLLGCVWLEIKILWMSFLLGCVWLGNKNDGENFMDDLHMYMELIHKISIRIFTPPFKHTVSLNTTHTTSH